VQEEWVKNGEEERTKNGISQAIDRIKQEGKIQSGHKEKKGRKTIMKTRGIRNLKKNDWKAIWKSVTKRRGG